MWRPLSVGLKITAQGFVVSQAQVSLNGFARIYRRKNNEQPDNFLDLDRDIGNFFYDLKPTRDAGVGLTEQTINYIVDVKGEPDWIREFRKNAYQVFNSKPLPTHWAGDELKEIDFDLIRYYLASGEATKRVGDSVSPRG